MRKICCLFFLLCVSSILFAKTVADDKITLEDLLDEMISFDEAVYFPQYFCLQESSYDRRSISPNLPGWWANDDGFGFVRTDNIGGRTEKVLFDQEGPGVITRIWITTQNKTGTLRFYFDDNTTPGWEVPAYDFVRFGIAMGEGLCQPHTSYEAELQRKGGSTFFFPIPYAQRCKITLEEPDPNNAPPRYYGINYRRYPAGIQVETFSQEVANRAAAKIQQADETLLNPPTFNEGTVLSDNQRLSPNKAVKINLPEGENAIRTITFKVTLDNPERYEQVMRELILETEFDSKKTSWVPLGDFSGAGMGAPYVKSWYLDADGKGEIVSRWVMPYKENGNITLTNHSNENVQVSVKVNVAPFEWNNRTLYFHTSWKQELEVPLTWNGSNNSPDNALDWEFALIEGKGVYRGDVLSLFNYAERWYGEGDEKIWVDDEDFPSHFGTGTEDYYNSSWAPVIPFHTPFGGAPRADKASSNGYNTFFRTRNLDGIPFWEKFKFEIEMICWDRDSSADYSSTFFWYGNSSAEAKNTSGIEEAKWALPAAGVYKITDCIEFETYPAADYSPSLDVQVQDMNPFSEGLWSGEYQRFFAQATVGDYVTYCFKDLKKVEQRLVIYLTKASDYGKLSFTINGQVSPVTFDGYSQPVVSSSPVDLGTYMPDENGEIELKITFIGTNSQIQGSRHLIGLDCIQIMEDPENYKVQGGLEFEDLTPSFQSSRFQRNEQEMFSSYQGGKWSNKSQSVFLNGQTNDYIEYRFDGFDALKQKITLYATKANDFGILTFYVNGEKISRTFDGYSPFVSHSGPIYLGAFLPDEEGGFTLKVQITGRSSKSTGNVLGLDCIRIEGVPGQEISSLSIIKKKNCSLQQTSTQLKVESENPISILSLYNVNGMLVAQEKANNILDINTLKKGVYLLEVLFAANDKSVFKVLI